MTADLPKEPLPTFGRNWQISVLKYAIILQRKISEGCNGRGPTRIERRVGLSV